VSSAASEFFGCFDDSLILSIFDAGYELGEDRQLVVEKKLRGVELGWALGAGIALLEKATLTCTA
jgi:guanosine-diphosphatase